MLVRCSSFKKITPPEAVAGVSSGEQVGKHLQESFAGQGSSRSKAMQIDCGNILALALCKKALG
jgi:hypothetical protein